MADGSPPWRPPNAPSAAAETAGARCTAGEYEEFEEALDGHYTGVGLSARGERDGLIQVTRVAAGSPAAAAGIRKGDRLRSVDGEKVDGGPRSPRSSLTARRPDDAPAGTAVTLGLERGTRRGPGPFAGPRCPPTP